MTETSGMLLESFERLLEDVATPANVRAAETSGNTNNLWLTLADSGFLEALVPENDGGAGLSFLEVYALLIATGEHALPVPFAETMVARALLARHGVPLPLDGPTVLSAPSALLPLAGLAKYALTQRSEHIDLAELDRTACDPFATHGAIHHTTGKVLATIPSNGIDLLAESAAITAAKMVGAMRRLLVMSIRYANERRQFGRTLSQFQAIQQQLAVMAENVAAAEVAARIGFSGERRSPTRVAVGKLQANVAARIVCNTAHAVHGAIGMTAEYDLQLYSRRLKEWQIAFGSESYWAARLGVARREFPSAMSIDFIRHHLQE